MIRVSTLDYHTAGEPLRIVTAGLPEIPGATMIAKRRYMKNELDHYRRFLTLEPRGHADMYGAVLTPPVTADGDVGVLFMHNEGYSTMCGHGIIGLAMVAVETGMVASTGEETVIRMDTPAGRVTATAHRMGGRVQEVSFENVPSFAYALDQRIEVPGLGSVQFDIGFVVLICFDNVIIIELVVFACQLRDTRIHLRNPSRRTFIHRLERRILICVISECTNHYD